MGYRFRLHVKSLPGTPDIVLPKFKTVIFVHGCFWHRHPGCRFAYTPKSRVEYMAKFSPFLTQMPKGLLSRPLKLLGM
jgi:DNA mismatch endonuclease (patch repair protein)